MTLLEAQVRAEKLRDALLDWTLEQQLDLLKTGKVEAVSPSRYNEKLVELVAAFAHQVRREALAELALEMEALRLKLHEALDGYRQNESWIRPVQLPMPERQRLYQECMYILKKLTQQAEEGGG